MKKAKHNGCRDCRDLDRRCDACREQNTRNMVRSRIRRGLMSLVRCFRCLQEHPKGERYCRLAAEWNGWPWPEEEAHW